VQPCMHVLILFADLRVLQYYCTAMRACQLPSCRSAACLLTCVLCSKTYCACPYAITPTASLAAPDGSGLRCYNDIQNEAHEASERPGWRHYQPPTAEVKPLLAASIAYTFPAEEVGELGVAAGV